MPRVIKSFCVGHRPPVFETKIRFQMLCPTPLGIEDEIVIADERFAIPNAGGSLAEYSQLFGLADLISAGDVVAEALFLFQYRKFISPALGGVQGNSPWVRVTSPAEAKSLFPTDEFLQSTSNKIIAGELYGLGESISANYARVHVVDDLVMFAAACARSGHLTDLDIRSFVTYCGLIPSPALSLIVVPVFLNVMKVLRDVWRIFCESFFVAREGYQRRVSGYLLERLHSFLLCKWILDGSESNVGSCHRYVVAQP